MEEIIKKLKEHAKWKNDNVTLLLSVSDAKQILQALEKTDAVEFVEWCKKTKFRWIYTDTDT